jgi:type IV pilus assembly protein PilE
MQSNHIDRRFTLRRGNASSRRACIDGVTLVELLIVLVVVAILTTIAVPSYREYIRKTNRTNAKQWLTEIANVQARYLIDARSYGDLSQLQMTMSPVKVGETYTVTAALGFDCYGRESAPAPGYCLTATPREDSVQKGDSVLQLDHRGNRRPPNVW